MKKFSEFGIKPDHKGFIGDKIKISKVLNREIIVHAFKIEDSKFDGKRLDMQIQIGETMHMLWTGSIVLMSMIQRIPKEDFPFLTTIVRENECYEFQ
jgi:hypothetical protein